MIPQERLSTRSTHSDPASTQKKQYNELSRTFQQFGAVYITYNYNYNYNK